MEEMKIVGYRDVDFKDKDTGREVRGLSLYVTYPDEGVIGQTSGKVFLTPAVQLDSHFSPEVGSTVRVTYNRKGKVSSIAKVTK